MSKSRLSSQLYLVPIPFSWQIWKTEWATNSWLLNDQFFSLAETTQLDGRNQKQSGRFSLLQLLMNINKGPGLTDRYRFYRNRIELIHFGRSSIVFFFKPKLWRNPTVKKQAVCMPTELLYIHDSRALNITFLRSLVSRLSEED